MLAKKNPHPRDSRIKFHYTKQVHADGSIHEDRWYEVDGNRIKGNSISSKPKIHFPNKFDAKKVYGNNDEKRLAVAESNRFLVEYGNCMHRHFFNWINALPFQDEKAYPNWHCYEDLPSWSNFKSFLGELEEHWEFYRGEWEIFSASIKLPGTIDAVLRDMRFPDELVFMVVDYKTAKQPTSFWCDCKSWSEDPAEHTDECSAVGQHPLSRGMLSRKCTASSIQVCLYAKILEDLYGARVSDIRLVYVNPNEELYVHKVDYSTFSDIVVDLLFGSKTT